MPLRTRKEDLSSINLTPLIDIIFLLIIFFMVGSRFTELNEPEKDIAINVPKVTNAKALSSAPRHRVINVFKDGTVQLDNDTVSLEQLKEQLSNATEQYNGLSVVVRSDAKSYHENFARVVAACRDANVTQLNMSVQEPTLQR